MPDLTFLYRWLKAASCWLLAASQQPTASSLWPSANSHQLAASEAARALTEQLAACRALLAVTMGERDQAQAALELAEQELRRLNVQQRKRRDADRYWITRTVTPREVSRN